MAAAQEERFSRIKNDPSFPSSAVAYCLSAAGLTASDLNLVGFYEKPFIKFERLLETYTATAPRGLRAYLRAMPEWLTDKLWMRDRISRELDGYAGEILFGDHHESHAASAFFPSPFEQAAILTVDGVGEWATASVAVGKGSELSALHELRFPHSLGLLYSAFTSFIGFKVNSGEYKLMGLAPYGRPEFVDLIKKKLLHINDDGSLWLNEDYFAYTRALQMTSPKLDALFGGPPRRPESPLTRREMDIARSIQAITEEAVLKMAAFARRETGMRDLCMAGGVALNCTANGRLRREGPFDNIWIQPAAGDAGGAVGVAFALWHRFLGKPRRSPEALGTWQRRPPASPDGTLPLTADGMAGGLLGPAFDEAEIELALAAHHLVAQRLDQASVAETVAHALDSGKVVGLLQGRMEFGPRALGARSILADARSATMRDRVNQAVKRRESFRPFAPSVLREHARQWFSVDGDSPYMLFAECVSSMNAGPIGAAPGEETHAMGSRQQDEIPAVTHVDGSARVQTVGPECGLFYQIIAAFHRLTGCPVVLNTSFNVRGEPLVCSPDDAIRCFRNANIDLLVMEGFVVTKSEQSQQALTSKPSAALP